MRHLAQYVALAFVMLSISISCSRPTSMEQFVRSDDAKKVGGFIFDVDMSDTLCTYDFDFYTRLDVRRSSIADLQDYPLSLTWTDPDGERLSFTTYLDAKAAKEQNYFSRDLIIPFMENVVPKKLGIWQLKVSVPDAVAEMGLRGFGLVARRNEK